MKSFLCILLSILYLFSINNAIDTSKQIISPQKLLEDAEKTVKSEPTRAIDIADKVFILLENSHSNNKYLKLKSKIIIGKGQYYKNQFQTALESFNHINIRILETNLKDDEKKFFKLFSESFYWSGKVYYKLNRYKKSLASYKKGLEYCTSNKNSIIGSKILISISRIYILISEYEKAISYAIQGNNSSKISGDMESLFFSYYYQGYVYRILGDYKKGLIKFNKSLEVSKKCNRVDLKVMAINEISNIYALQNKYDKALNLKKKAIKISETNGLLSNSLYCLNDIAHILFMKGNYDKALTYFIRSKEIGKINSNVRERLIIDINIAKTHAKMGNTDKSFKIAISAFEIAKKHNLKSITMMLAKLLSELSLREKKYIDAYNYLEQAFKLNKDIFNVKRGNRIAELETEIDMKESENKIILLEKINKIKQLELDKKNKFITLQKVSTFLLIIIVFLIFLAYRWKIKANIQLRKKGKELEKILAEIHHLSGLLPICSSCKKIRDDKGYWHQVEEYIKSHSEASFSHSMCPSCIKEIYPKRNHDKKL